MWNGVCIKNNQEDFAIFILFRILNLQNLVGKYRGVFSRNRRRIPNEMQRKRNINRKSVEAATRPNIWVTKLNSGTRSLTSIIIGYILFIIDK